MCAVRFVINPQFFILISLIPIWGGCSQHVISLCLDSTLLGAKSVQGRLNSIIGSRAIQYTGALTYTTTRKNKNVNGR